MDEPIRLVQTNLRETDAVLNPKRHVRQVAEFGANALLFNLGGIVAFYPTRVDKQETGIPGLCLLKHGSRELAYVPWDIGSLYFRHSSPAHAGFMADLIDYLLSGRRQLRTDAHPLVEVTLMRQHDRRRTLVHFVNLSGHSDTAYFDPVPFRSVRVGVRGDFSRARAVRLRKPLALAREEGSVSFVLPQLDDYEVVVLE